jgi:N6-L-threonylcarbamoyladenine synthase
MHAPPLVHCGRIRQRAAARNERDLTIILGLESSCDDSAAALVTSERRILAQAVVGQTQAHQPYGGVVPEIAARAHVEILPALIERVLDDAKLSVHDVDAVAATAGPGLIGGVMVALLAGKGLALAAGKPLIAVNHLEGHALSPRLVDPDLSFPYLLLLVSGGHCQLLEARGVGDYRRLATTIDDAAGEAFDKAAKLLALGYPGGPAIERLAKGGDPAAVPLPRPLAGSGEPHFSFAGLKSAVQRAVVSGEYSHEDIAASFQQAVVDCLVDRTVLALGKSDAPALVVAGGVAANQTIRGALADLARREGRAFTVPPAWICTDNAAMIAWAGAERFAAGLTDPLDFAPRARWPLDPEAEKVRGAGVKA